MNNLVKVWVEMFKTINCLQNKTVYYLSYWENGLKLDNN